MKWSKAYWFSGDYIIIREEEMRYVIYLRAEPDKIAIGKASSLREAKRKAEGYHAKKLETKRQLNT